MSEVSKEVLLRKIERLKLSRAQAENLLEKKSRELFLLNQDLESQVKKRTEDFKKARDEAVQANKYKDTFLAHMSHEIRTPLNGITSILSLLKRTDLNDQQGELVSIIENSSDILLGVINDILEYSKIKAGKIVLEKREFNLKQTFESVLNLLYFKATEKSISLILDYPPSLKESFFSDEGKIKQILVNLIGNSIKFTSEGHIIVRLSSDQSYNIKIKIIDTGIGISKEKQSSVFKSFTQADASDTRKFGGTGLGLSIVKYFIDELGGKIKVESEVGEGTIFTLTLPSLDEQSMLKKINLIYSESTFGILVKNPIRQLVLSEQLKSLGADINILNLDGLKSLSAMNNLILISDYNTDMGMATFERENLISSLYLICNPMEQKKWASTYPSLRFLSPLLKSSEIFNLTSEFQLKSVLVNKKKNIPKDDLKKISVNSEKSKIRILVVEDNLINQKIAKLLLGDMGYTCDFADNGAVAVSKCTSKMYDIILMDYNMPEMDGLQATKAIRALVDGNTPYIIGLTASALKETERRCLDAGMDGFVTKPIEEKVLLSKIQLVEAKLK